MDMDTLYTDGMDTRTLTLFLPVVLVVFLVFRTSPRDDNVPDDDDVYLDK
jgi:hypothetical protein